MIFTWLINLVGLVLGAVFGLLPDVVLPFFADPSTGTATELGGNAVWVNSYVPVVEAFAIMAFLVKWVLPALGVYALASWAWRHVPTLWGFGTGAG